MRRFAGLLLFSFAFAVSGCGTMVHGTKQNLSVSTVPAGAQAVVGTQQCVTPCTMDVSRNAKNIHLESEGYKSTDMELDKKFNGGATILGNILWLLPGVVVDVYSGGAYEIQPVNVTLNKAQTPESALLDSSKDQTKQ